MLDPLYRVVAEIILFFHAGFSRIFGDASGASWALAIVFLTISVRVVLFPLFVKQIRAQRAMQTLQPQIKALQAKHKGDRETLNREMMALYKTSGANPLAGCLPLILQLPIFFSLFHVLRNIKPTLVDGHYVYSATNGISQQLVQAAAQAKVFGAPIAAAFTSPSDLLQQLGGANPTVVKIVSTTAIVLMGVTTFLTQRQMMARNTATDSQQQMIQKVMLYVLPFSFAIFGFNFPIGVLLYWLTTNVWSMAQQQWVIRSMPMPGAAGGAPGTAPDSPAKGGPGPRPGGRWGGSKTVRPGPATASAGGGGRAAGAGVPSAKDRAGKVTADTSGPAVSLSKPGAGSSVRTGPPRRGKQSRAKRRGGR